VTGNGNGHSAELIKGRGIRHRKATRAERVALAADVATGVKRVDLSNGQLCDLFNVSAVELRDELQRRAAATNGNGGAQRSVLDIPVPDMTTPTLREMAAELVDHLDLDGAVDLLVAITER
jgi:hypothetical protein